MLNFQSALSGLRASQVAINIFSNNIANANTPGYSRQSVALADRLPVYQRGLLVGNGVEVSRINRIASATIESAIVENASSIGNSAIGLSIARRIESILSPGSGSISERLQSFFDTAQNAQARPDSSIERSVFVQAAQELSSEFNRAAESFERLRVSTVDDLNHTVANVNQKLAELFETNRQIAVAEAKGQNPNDLYDRHQLQLEEVSEFVQINASKSAKGFEYQIANYSVNRTGVAIQAEFDSVGSVTFRTEGGFELKPDAGALAGYQEFLNNSLNTVRKDLNHLVTNFIQSVDQIHATGLNADSGFNLLFGQRSVSDSNIPLAESSVPFTLTQGDIFVSVTNTVTGERELNRISFDPESQSLQSLADSISKLDHVQALISSPPDLKLSIVAQAGFEFDFAGRLATSPDRSGITGDAAIKFSGQYTGNNNDTFSFAVVGNGTVGVSDNLTVRATRENGEIVGDFNLGVGYEPGSSFEVADGVQIQFESGELVDGDSFNTFVVQNADTTGSLTALGLNTLFVGVDASNIKVNSQILGDNSRLSLSRNGDLGDGGNAQRLNRLRDELVIDGRRTFTQQLSYLEIQSGLEVNTIANQRNSQLQLQQRLLGEREAVSGVDQNEELVRMLQFQESFQASIRVISTIDEMMTELMNVVR